MAHRFMHEEEGFYQDRNVLKNQPIKEGVTVYVGKKTQTGDWKARHAKLLQEKEKELREVAEKYERIIAEARQGFFMKCLFKGCNQCMITGNEGRWTVCKYCKELDQPYNICPDHSHFKPYDEHRKMHEESPTKGMKRAEPDDGHDNGDEKSPKKAKEGSE